MRPGLDRPYVPCARLKDVLDDRSQHTDLLLVHFSGHPPFDGNRRTDVHVQRLGACLVSSAADHYSDFPDIRTIKKWR